MTQSFGINIATIDDSAVEAGLELLSQPPDWIVAIEDLDRMRADLERVVPELASGELRLKACKFKRARIENGTWTSLCRLKVEDPDGGSYREVDLRGTLLPPGVDPPVGRVDDVPFGEEGWRCYLPDLRWDFVLEKSDTSLPAMPALTDPERARTLLEGALRESAGGLDDIEIAACTPKIMRYREGRRCTIRYELEYAPDRRQAHWPESILAKVYEGDEGEGTHEAMRALWASPMRTSTTVRIAEPLAIVPEQNVMMQSIVPGEKALKEHIKTAFASGLDAGIDAMSGHVRKAGRGLAELHTSGAVAGEIVTWDDQVASIRHASDELATVVPAVNDAMEPLLAELAALGEKAPAGPLVPTHRSFRPAQLLMHHDDMAFIDFDGFCQAEAGLDLALFRATLVDLSLRAMEKGDELLSPDEQQAAQIRLDELCGTFLAGYEEVTQYDAERLALWDLLTSVKDILDCWRKIKFEHLERRMRFLHHKLGTLPIR
jgi:hypothetical protein